MATPKLVMDPASLWHMAPYPAPYLSYLKKVSLCHPGRSDGQNTILRWAALDHSMKRSESREVLAYKGLDLDPLRSGDDLDIYDEIGGVHQATLILACFVLTGGKNGVLSPKRLTQTSQIEELFSELNANNAAYDDILTEEKYYFYPLDFFQNPRYQIVSSFREWKLPEAHILNANPVFAMWDKASSDNLDSLKSAGLD
ncbi:hypothetical protein TWF696_002409 [Orbilia brochopaga]|uniref:Uncharacterized protein n=1 Tax=Orbilia brochopaga TaxID=3140254 RepID=A0AAV9U8G9_9PEZI